MLTLVLRTRTACTTCLLAAPIIALVSLIGSAQSPSDKADRRDWIQLFDGKSLDGWVPKITGYPLEKTTPTPSASSTAPCRRRPTGPRRREQIRPSFLPTSEVLLLHRRRRVPLHRRAGGRRSRLGHSQQWPDVAQPVAAIDVEGPGFPISVEVQLLGGLPNGKPQSTANMCSPGTQVFIDGTMVKGHCLDSKSQTYAGDQWVRVEVAVRGGERLIHKVEGQTVLEYEKPTIGGGEVNKFDPAVKVDGTLLTDGYIEIQGESHPTEFRKIEVLNLSGCMDSKSPKSKSYYVHQSDGACK